MKKKILFFILICFSVLLFSELSVQTISQKLVLDELLDDATKIIIASFKEIPANKTKDKEGVDISGIGILPIENDIGDKLFIRMKEEFSRTKFFLYEKDKIDKLLNEQSIQQQDFYSKEGRLKIGGLTQWKGLIFGKLEHHIEKNFGKEKVYLEVSLNFDNLETGQIIWSEHYTINKKVKYSIIYFGIGILSIFGLVFGLNLINKGRNPNPLIGMGLLMLILYSIWFFVI